jgi:VWFA-related protein
MRIRCGVYCGMLACFAWSASTWAQPPAAAPAATAQPAPITVHVTVTDKSGHLVSGLQKSDFTLLDDRHAVPIQDFDAASPAQPPLVMILIDQVNSQITTQVGNSYAFRDLSQTQTQIGNFLASYHSHLPFPVSLMFLTNSGVDEIKPTVDGTALSAVLRQHLPQLQVMKKALYQRLNLFNISLDNLETILANKANVPQRKLLIWVGSGWPVIDTPSVTLTIQQQKQFFQSIVVMSDLLRVTNTTLYAVDPEGNTDVGNSNTVFWQDFLKPVTRVDKALPGDLALQVLALQSGGLLRIGGNNVAQAVTACTQDASGGYDLTFQPQADSNMTTFHPLEVKLDKRGLKARTLDGYYTQQ